MIPFSHSEITILFDEPFWIALFERHWEGQYMVAREVIGASEPTGTELKLFFEKNKVEHLRFVTSESDSASLKKPGFKLQMRRTKQNAQPIGQKHVYTKVHGLLKMQKTEFKEQHQHQSLEVAEVLKELKFELRQQKKKEKHKGR